jgi:hypothetical protein
VFLLPEIFVDGTAMFVRPDPGLARGQCQIWSRRHNGSLEYCIYDLTGLADGEFDGLSAQECLYRYQRLQQERPRFFLRWTTTAGDTGQGRTGYDTYDEAAAARRRLGDLYWSFQGSTSGPVGGVPAGRTIAYTVEEEWLTPGQLRAAQAMWKDHLRWVAHQRVSKNRGRAVSVVMSDPDLELANCPDVQE